MGNFAWTVIAVGVIAVVSEERSRRKQNNLKARVARLTKTLE